jgi:uncharacterized protein (DUF1501 family)
MIPSLTPTRRDALRFGFAGALGLPTLLQLRAASRAATSPTPATPTDTAVIFVMLGGGASQHETYDPKPDAPAEYRGPFASIPTAIPGVRFSELLPEQAQRADQLAVIRSVTHHEASHIALHAIETGAFLRDRTQALKGDFPAIGSVVSRVRGGVDGLPGFVALPKAHAYCGPHWLGGEHAPFNVNDNPNTSAFAVSNLALRKGLTTEQLTDRHSLSRTFAAARRDLDDSPDTLDAFRRQALDLLTGPRARDAFAIDREPIVLRDRYGRSALGQRLLLARRLVEVGVPFVMVRTFGWDDHDNLAQRMKDRAGEYDLGLTALIDDLLDRGLTRNVLVVAMGEFGRTPRVNAKGGRDHWPAVSSVLFAGGSYRMGQVIGASDAHGGRVVAAPYAPQSVLGMVYRHLGIDPALTFPDFTGRPRHLLDVREPIAELL